MHGQRVLLLATLILSSTFCLSGQAPRLYEREQYGVAAVCNDGKIPFSVARAARDSKELGIGGDEWVIHGWFNVDPGKCTQIGEGMTYHSGGWFGEDSVSLLAFAFWDSKGVWRGIKVEGGQSGWFYPIYPSNQQICVPRDGFSYRRNSPKQIDLARQCERAAAGYTLIPASYMYKGSSRSEPTIFDGPRDPHDYLHITIGSDDRAFTSGVTWGSAGISHGLDGASTNESGAAKNNATSGSPLLKELAKAVAEQRQKEDQAAAAAEAERQRQAQANSPEGRLQRAREQQVAREQKQKQILAADAAGDPNVKIEAQMIRREEENNRQRWAGTRQSPAAYDPHWMGQNVAIVGTVSRVEVDPDPALHWVTIYFKESPDATFVVCSPYPDLFQERVGLNLNALVGKTLEAAGQVEAPYCGQTNVSKGSIRVVGSKQWQVH